MARKGLKDEILEKIDRYLSGKLSKKEISQWAIGVLTHEVFKSHEILLEDAVTSLAGLHDEDDRFDTAKEDLIYLRECLIGRAMYQANSLYFHKSEVS